MDTKAVMSRLGEVVWLMLHAPGYREAELPAVEEMFLRPLMINQLRVYRRGDRPVGMVSWAWLSEGAEAEYLATGRLGPDQWRSGDRLWFTDFLAPFGDIRGVTKAARQIIPRGTYGYGTRRDDEGRVLRVARYPPLHG